MRAARIAPLRASLRTPGRTQMAAFLNRGIATMFPAPLPPTPRPSRKAKFFRYTGLATLGAAAITYAYYKQATWNAYPPVVEDLLQAGLMAELESKDSPADPKAALLCYLQALEEADKSKLHALSDEYTGLQLKVAEMYEKLGMMNEARLMYRELSTAFIQALADGTNVPARLRPHLIQRGLRVALRTAYLESTTNVEVAKMSLIVHFMMAQEEVAKRSPEMAKLIKESSGGTKGSGQLKRFNIVMSMDGQPPESEFHEAWQPFRDELFLARDMFVALCIATGDIGLAIQTKLASTEWMAASGYNSSDTLMSFYNVGAIFYLQAESLDMRLHAQSPSNPTPDSSSLEPINVLPKTGAPPPSQKDLAKMSKISIANANACFSLVLKLITKLPSKVRREGDIDDVQALATYGMGVVALHRGELDKASELLREARLRAKGCGYVDLIKNSESELAKVDLLKKSRIEGGNGSGSGIKQAVSSNIGENVLEKAEGSKIDLVKPVAPPVALKKNT